MVGLYRTFVLKHLFIFFQYLSVYVHVLYEMISYGISFGIFLWNILKS